MRSALVPRPSGVLGWLRQRDRGLMALRRATRTAVVMPAMFALGDVVLDDPQLATFAAFGSFAMLLLVDFAGPMRGRLLAQAALGVAGAVLVCVGTLLSTTTWAAALAMGIVAFGVVFAGVVSSVLAGATTSLLLAFILPISIAGPASAIPHRVAGWGLAAVAALLAVRFLWPAPERDPIRGAAIAACRAVAARLRAEVSVTGLDAAVADADGAVERLHDTFFATPYRPTGLSTAARAVVRLVDELQWLSEIAGGPPQPPVDDVAARAVTVAAATVLERGADLLDAPDRSPDELRAALDALRHELAELERVATERVPDAAADVISALDPGFRAQELSFIVTQIGANVDLAAAADRRSWMEQLLGRQPAGLSGRLSAAQERAGAHVERQAVWLQNSVRAAVALTVAVLVADLSNVQHSFWVVLGTLSVLRSNALSTGQDAVRGILGTLAGFVVGGVLVSVIGTNTTLLWVLLPPAVLFAGLAPATISFAAGQAAFTVTLLILFNLIAPEGWQIGLVRIEDVLLGSGVSLLVGLVFWPRGAGAALGDALAEAYAESADYLAEAVAFGIGRCDAAMPPRPAPDAEAMRAAAAARRLDVAFRGFLAERGAKPLPLAEVTSLVTGVVGLRLAADAVLDLWHADGAARGDRAGARRELVDAAGQVTGWYRGFGASLRGRGPVPDPLPHDPTADDRLVAAVAQDLRGDRAAGATAVRVLWTGDHLDAARRLQDLLVGPARAAVAQRAAGRRLRLPRGSGSGLLRSRAARRVPARSRSRSAP